MGLADNCEAYWKFEESSGTFSDATSNGHNSDAVSGVSYHQSGKIGYCVNIDGTADYISIPDSPKWCSGSAFSINLWIKSTDTAGVFLLGQWGDAGAGNASWRVSLSDISAGKPSMVNYNGGASTLGANSAVTDGNWHMVTYVYDGGTSGTNGHIYIDGNLSNEGTLNKSPIDSGYKLTIGDTLAGGGNPVICYLDEVAYFTTNLTSGSVTQLWNGGAGLQYPFTTDIAYNATAFSLSFSSKTPAYFLTKNISSALSLSLTLNSFSSVSQNLQLSTPAGTKGTEAIRKDRWGKTATSFKSFGEKRYYQV